MPTSDTQTLLVLLTEKAYLVYRDKACLWESSGMLLREVDALRVMHNPIFHITRVCLRKRRGLLVCVRKQSLWCAWESKAYDVREKAEPMMCVRKLSLWSAWESGAFECVRKRSLWVRKKVEEPMHVPEKVEEPECVTKWRSPWMYVRKRRSLWVCGRKRRILA